MTDYDVTLEAKYENLNLPGFAVANPEVYTFKLVSATGDQVGTVSVEIDPTKAQYVEPFGLPHTGQPIQSLTVTVT